MRGRGAWLLLAGLAILIVILVIFRGPGSAGESPEHRSTSDAASGTSALRLYAEALGHPTGAVEGDFILPDRPGLLFVFTPTQAVRRDEAQKLAAWVGRGGVLVYAAEQGDASLDQQFAVKRVAQQPRSSGAIRASAPILNGVSEVSGALASSAIDPGPSQVPLLRNAAGVVATMARSGRGQVVAFSDPLTLCNGYLGLRDNGRLAADLIALTPPGGSVLFDEYHHGVIAGSPLTGWLGTAWGGALAWAVVVIFFGLALRGRAFGPRIQLVQSGDRSSAEYARAVGSLLRRSGGRRVTMDELVRVTRRSLAAQLGIGGDPQSADFPAVVDQRSSATGAALREAERRAAQASNDTDMVAAARALHALAYPPLPASRRSDRA